MGRHPHRLRRHDEFEHFLDPVFAAGIAQPPTAATPSNSTLAGISVLTALLGFYIAYIFYYKKPGTAAALAAQIPRPLLASSTTSSTSTKSTTHVLVTPLLMFTRIILGGLVDTRHRQRLRLARRRNHPRPQLAHPPHSVRKHPLLRRLARARSSRRPRRHDLRPPSGMPL